MKNSYFLLALAGMLMSSMVSKAQTTVSGNLAANTVWTVSSSPYQIVGDVGVPSGITLTIEPGVQVQFSGGHTIQVQGQLLATGTGTNRIVFNSDTATNGLMILFRRTNLSNSKISNVNFIGNIKAVQLAQESEFVNDNPKNSGVLLVDSCTFDHSSVQTNGYSTTASLSINNSQFDHSTIKGVYARSESITVKNSSIVNSTIWSDAYNYGITVDGSTVRNSQFKLGCCGGNFNISNSTVLNSTMVGGDGQPQGGAVRLSNSMIVETPINLRWSQFVISRCILVYLDSSASQPSDTGTVFRTAIFGIGTITNSTFVGNGSNTELEITGTGSYYIGGNVDISKSEFIGGSTALKFSNADSVVIQKTSFINNSRYNIENLTSRDITATQNYWSTNDAAEVAAKILDGHDNLNYGMVNVEPILTVPDADAPVSPPENATKWVSSDLMRLSWKRNQESDIAGYKIYYGNFTGYSFSNVVNVGNVGSTVLPAASVGDTIAVTAYDSQADGINDQLDGHESWYAIFTVAPPPSTPVLAAPVNGLSGCSTSLTLTWNAMMPLCPLKFPRRSLSEA